jgi:hypothetical protein
MLPRKLIFAAKAAAMHLIKMFISFAEKWET